MSGVRICALIYLAKKKYPIVSWSKAMVAPKFSDFIHWNLSIGAE